MQILVFGKRFHRNPVSFCGKQKQDQQKENEQSEKKQSEQGINGMSVL